jgi:DNA replication protein DnaC
VHKRVRVHVRNREQVVVLGPIGSGKSFIASALAQKVYRDEDTTPRVWWWINMQRLDDQDVTLRAVEHLRRRCR